MFPQLMMHDLRVMKKANLWNQKRHFIVLECHLSDNWSIIDSNLVSHDFRYVSQIKPLCWMCGLKANNHTANVTAHLCVTMMTMHQYIAGPFKFDDSFLSLAGIILLSPTYHRKRVAIMAHLLPPTTCQPDCKNRADGKPACKVLHLATTA